MKESCVVMLSINQMGYSLNCVMSQRADLQYCVFVHTCLNKAPRVVKDGIFLMTVRKIQWSEFWIIWELVIYCMQQSNNKVACCGSTVVTRKSSWNYLLTSPENLVKQFSTSCAAAEMNFADCGLMHAELWYRGSPGSSLRCACTSCGSYFLSVSSLMADTKATVLSVVLMNSRKSGSIFLF